MSHLTHLRIQQAVRLISETDEKLTEVARRVGFANGNSFAVLHHFTAMDPITGTNASGFTKR